MNRGRLFSPCSVLFTASEKRLCREFLSRVISVVSLLLLSGCAAYWPAEEQRSARPMIDFTPGTNGSRSAAICKSLHPRIHSIGTSRILTFERTPSRPSTARLEIVVEGRDLFVEHAEKGKSEKCNIIGVQVLGTVPAEQGNEKYPKDFYVDWGPVGAGAFSIILTEQYLKRVSTGDRLTIWIVVNEKISDGKERERALFYGIRHFTLYEVNDYRREVLKSRVKMHNLEATPLSMNEALNLFGSLIANGFFVVRLSVRNDTDTDKLINTGMIKASGRVLVEPPQVKGSQEKIPRFTVPVEVVPQSLEQVFTILDDEEVNQTRPVVFRGLEFIGALSQAILPLAGANLALSQGFGLYTGVAIPETKRLWPDRWPGYKRNVVALGMPDLLKVPKGSVAGHKYLFFSKNKIQGIIADQNYLGEFRRPEEETQNLLDLIFGPKGPQQPDFPRAAVISVAFDSLDVPFENVVAAQAESAHERVAKADLRIRSLVSDLEDIRTAWKEQRGSLFFGTLLRAELSEAAKNIEAAKRALLTRRESLQTDQGALSVQGKREGADRKIRASVNALASARQAAAGEKADLALLKAELEKLQGPGEGSLRAASEAVDGLGKDPKTAAAFRSQLADVVRLLNGQQAEVKTVSDLAKGLADPSKLQSALTGIGQRLAKLSEELQKAQQTVAKSRFIFAEAATWGSISAELDFLAKVAAAAAPNRVEADLLNHRQYGLSQLKVLIGDLGTLQKALARGGSTEGFNILLKSIEDAVEKGHAALHFYKLSASVMKSAARTVNGSLGGKLRDLGKLKDAEVSYSQETAGNDLNALKQNYTDKLRDAHGDLGIVAIPPPNS